MTEDSNIEEQEMIDRFLMGEMKGQELENFQARLAKDAVLQSRVKETRLLITGLQESVLSSRLDSFHQELPARVEKPAPVRSMKRFVAAASVLLILSIAAVRFFTQPAAHEKLYTTYFQPDPGLLTAMGSSDNYNFDRGMVDYKSGKYPEAIKIWQEINTNSGDTLAYFLASAYIAWGKIDSAFTYYKKVPESSAFASEAHWYNGLILLKNKKFEEAITELQQSARKEKNELIEKIRKR